MAGHAKNHHYVASFHLSQFTLTGKKSGRLYVFDKRQRSRSPWPWPTTPDGAAKEGDFYGIEEGELAKKIETPASRIVKDINETKELPHSPEDLNTLFHYVALAAVRIPGVRQRINSGIETIVNQLKRLGGNEEPQIDTAWHVETMLHVVERARLILPSRYAVLRICEDDAPDLICSDWPGVFRAIEPLPWPFTPNFGTPHTVLSLPVGRRCLLELSTDPVTSECLKMNGPMVAAFNSLTAQQANQIYAGTDDWVWLDPDGNLANSNDFSKSLPPTESL